MEEKMTASSIMTKEIIKIKPNATIGEAIKSCVDHKVGGLVVVNENEDAVGVLSEKDLLVAYDFLAETNSTVAEFFSKELVSINEDTPILEIIRLLVQRNFKRVPVVRGKKVVGIVSRADILRWIASTQINKK